MVLTSYFQIGLLDSSCLEEWHHRPLDQLKAPVLLLNMDGLLILAEGSLELLVGMVTHDLLIVM